MRRTRLLCMTLYRDGLTKISKKGRAEAVSLLSQLSQVAGLPEPVYQYEAGGYVKKPMHFMKVRFRVPQFLNDNMSETIVGSGRDRNKQFAKSLAALEVVHRLEESLNAERNSIPQLLQEFIEQREQKQAALEAVPVDQGIPDVDSSSLPLDLCSGFEASLPAKRTGRLEFFPALMKDEEANLAARAITVTSAKQLPKVGLHANQTDEYESLQRWANIKAFGGPIDGISSPHGTHEKDVSARGAIFTALRLLHNKIQKSSEHDESVQRLLSVLKRHPSFGMAKLFVELPKHQINQLNELLQQTEPFDRSTYRYSRRVPQSRQSNRTISSDQSQREQEQQRRHRLETFRQHQQIWALPVDSVEDILPYYTDVTIVRGGTGSGKTTRYPTMVSLLTETQQVQDGQNQPEPKILVAQPRRLACQAAAQRVALEQGYSVDDMKSRERACPIGYSIRFESYPSVGSRTIDFQTPGVILRRATQDPLLADFTHLFLDEVHERNADMDLLLALAKLAQRQRLAHPTLPKLKIILMSASLDSSHWESYFTTSGNDQMQELTCTSIPTVTVVDVPDVRRFENDIVHLGDPSFPPLPRGLKNRMIRRGNKDFSEELDETICEAAAELALNICRDQPLRNESILIFLPGMEEIQLVNNHIQSRWRHVRNQRSEPDVLFLHSSVSSRAQSRIFQPGPKIILSTNIAETSLTIPDVRYVIDSGRERQYSLLDSISDSTTVVGSQLVTVDISQASAKQRAGRAGRVAAGTCYRLYSQDHHDQMFLYTKPEMLRMDLSQLILHSVSLYHPTVGAGQHPFSLLLSAPDPPSEKMLRQSLFALSGLRLVGIGSTTWAQDAPFNSSSDLYLTPMGEMVSELPVSPRIGRVLVLGLAVRAIEPALTIAGLLSIPKVFQSIREDQEWSTETHSSDIIKAMDHYDEFLLLNDEERKEHPQRKLYSQVSKIRSQLERGLEDSLGQAIKRVAKPKVARKEVSAMSEVDNGGETASWSSKWNINAGRVGALVSLIVGASPHIAHLVNHKNDFATRDIAGNARIHPSSVNYPYKNRTFWYVYNDLRVTKQPYMHVTTAASPLELALFASDGLASSSNEYNDDEEDTDMSSYSEMFQQLQEDHPNLLFIGDQWIPVASTNKKQRGAFLRLKQLLTDDMLQTVAADPEGFLDNGVYQQIVFFALSAIEQQRLEK